MNPSVTQNNIFSNYIDFTPMQPSWSSTRHSQNEAPVAGYYANSFIFPESFFHQNHLTQPSRRHSPRRMMADENMFSPNYSSESYQAGPLATSGIQRFTSPTEYRRNSEWPFHDGTNNIHSYQGLGGLSQSTRRYHQYFM